MMIPRRWLVPGLTISGLLLAAGLGALLFLNDPADRCRDAGGRFDAGRRRCEMAPPPKGPVNTAVVGAAGAARVLDLTSFRNSTGPRRRPEAKTPADHGFTQVVRTRDGVELYRDDQSWMMTVRVLEDGPEKKLLCIGDFAMSGGTYKAMQTIEVRPGPDGLLKATAAKILDPRCPPFPGQG